MVKHFLELVIANGNLLGVIRRPTSIINKCFARHRNSNADKLLHQSDGIN